MFNCPYIIELNTVQVFLCFNRAPRHEGLLGSGGIDPLIL